MAKLCNKIVGVEIGLLYTDDPINTKKDKGIILEIEVKTGILSKKHLEKIWLSMKTAALLELIPREHGLHTDKQHEDFIKKYCIGKTLNLNLITKDKLVLLKKRGKKHGIKRTKING